MEKTLAVVSRIIGAIIAVLFLSYFWWQTSQHVGANLPPVVQKLNSLLPRQQVADTDEQSIVSTHKQLQLAVCDLSRDLITWKLEDCIDARCDSSMPVAAFPPYFYFRCKKS